MFHYLAGTKKNQRGQLLWKILILSLIPLILHCELAASDDWCKLARFKYLPLNLKEINQEGKMLFFSPGRCMSSLCVCVFVSTNKVNTKQTLPFTVLALCYYIINKVRQGGRGRSVGHRAQVSLAEVKGGNNIHKVLSTALGLSKWRLSLLLVVQTQRKTTSPRH